MWSLNMWYVQKIMQPMQYWFPDAVQQCWCQMSKTTDAPLGGCGPILHLLRKVLSERRSSTLTVNSAEAHEHGSFTVELRCFSRATRSLSDRKSVKRWHTLTHTDSQTFFNWKEAKSSDEALMNGFTVFACLKTTTSCSVSPTSAGTLLSVFPLLPYFCCHHVWHPTYLLL